MVIYWWESCLSRWIVVQRLWSSGKTNRNLLTTVFVSPLKMVHTFRILEWSAIVRIMSTVQVSSLGVIELFSDWQKYIFSPGVFFEVFIMVYRLTDICLLPTCIIWVFLERFSASWIYVFPSRLLFLEWIKAWQKCLLSKCVLWAL